VIEFEKAASVGRGIFNQLSSVVGSGLAQALLVLAGLYVGFTLYWRFIRGDW
jgi:hypothetical protein